MGILRLISLCCVAVTCLAVKIIGYSPAARNEGFAILKNGIRLTKCKESEVLDPNTQLCHTVGERGPCGLNMRFYRNEENPIVGKCQCIKRSWREPPLVSWPEHNQCYQLFTQGPCDSGEWLVLDQNQGGAPTCKLAECEQSLTWWEQYPRFTFACNSICYTTGTQGPCPTGYEVLFDVVSGPLCFSTSPSENGIPPVVDDSLGYRSPRCLSSHQAYDPVRGKCYLTNVQGPCGDSMVFARTQNNFYHGQCRCIEQSPYQPPLILSRDHNQCFRLFSQGPCRDGEWLIPGSDDSYVSSGAICAPDKCSNGNQSLEVGQYNFIYDNTCYVGGSEGVCPEKLILGYEKMGPICFGETPVVLVAAFGFSVTLPFDCPEGTELTGTNVCSRRTRLRSRQGRDVEVRGRPREII